MAAERDRALAVLIRLARQAQNHERSLLVAIDRRLDAVDGALATLEGEVAHELQGGAEVGAAGTALGPFLQASKVRRTALQEARRQLEHDRAGQLEQLAASRLELRRLEILRDRRVARAQTARARRDQKELDDLVSLRAAARPR